MVRRIRDLKVRQLVEERLAEYGDNPKKAFGDSNNPLLHVDGKTQINSVRITENLNKNTAHPICDNKGKPYKYFAYGNNHHVEIIENIKTGRREGVFVTAMEAAKRVRRDRSEIVQKDHGVEWKFLMSLCVNDMVEVEDSNGQKNLYRVQKLDGSSKRFTLRLQTAARLDDDSTELRKTPNNLRCSKIEVDPLGNITQCND
jgi:CRISPR-associated endonuclease Csn1